jgi:hypothetical protein
MELYYYTSRADGEIGLKFVLCACAEADFTLAYAFQYMYLHHEICPPTIQLLLRRHTKDNIIDNVILTLDVSINFNM